MNEQRSWLSYNSTNDSLYCTICIAYAHCDSTFISGQNNWRRMSNSVREHECAVAHKRSMVAYTCYLNKSNLTRTVIKAQQVQSQEIENNRAILSRVITVVKLLGKRGLSYRGSTFEAAYTLDKYNLDHGNFLEIVLTLAKYDDILKVHMKKVIEQSKKAHNSGSKGRGDLLIIFFKDNYRLHFSCY